MSSAGNWDKQAVVAKIAMYRSMWLRNKQIVMKV